MSKPNTEAPNYYQSTPYQEAFDIEYPQENLEGEMYKYRCKSCKIITTDINGRLENHGPNCAYKLQRLSGAA